MQPPQDDCSAPSKVPSDCAEVRISEAATMNSLAVWKPRRWRDAPTYASKENERFEPSKRRALIGSPSPLLPNFVIIVSETPIDDSTLASAVTTSSSVIGSPTEAACKSKLMIKLAVSNVVGTPVGTGVGSGVGSGVG